MKFKTGGVTRLSLRTVKASQGLIDLIHSFQLESFTLVNYHLFGDPFRQFVHGLSPTLRELCLPTSSMHDIFVLDEIERFPAHKQHIASSSSAIWKIRDSYPKLETLYMHASAVDDPILVVKILASLPSSLTYLKLFPTPAMDILRVLPPNLTHIRDLRQVPTAEQAERLDGLTKLGLHIPMEVIQSSMSPKWSIPRATQGSNLLLAFPRHLSELHLDCKPSDFMALPPMPPTLTKLKAVFPLGILRHKPWNRPSEVFSLVPPSVTDLTFIGVVFSDEEAKKNDSRPRKALDELPVLDRVKRFQFHYYVIYTVEFDVSSLRLQELITMVPSAEFFELKGSRGSPELIGLGIEHLKLFKNPLELRSLIAPISSECLALSNRNERDTLGSIFPNLQELHLLSHGEGFSPPVLEIDFASLPPRLTSLICSEKVTSDQIPILPRSVTRVELENVTVKESYLLQHSSPPSSDDSVDQSLNDSEESSESELSRISAYVTRRIGIYRIFRSKRDGATFMILGDSIPGYDPIGSAQINSWTVDAPDLPSWTTELTIASLRHPLDLPLLTKLSVDVDMMSDYSFAGLPSLVDLTLGKSYSSNTIASLTLPPTLTRFTWRFNTWPITSLPTSITYLCGYELPLKHVSSLKNLKTFRELGWMLSGSQVFPRKFQLAEWIEYLPRSITSLEVPLRQEQLLGIEERLSNFWNHFSSLESFAICGTIAHVILDKVYHSLPSSLAYMAVTANSDSFDVSPALLASRAGLKPGDVTLRPTDKFDTWSARQFPRAYPKIVCERPFSHRIANIQELAPFMPYLSPSTATLDLAYLDWSETPRGSWVYNKVESVVSSFARAVLPQWALSSLITPADTIVLPSGLTTLILATCPNLTKRPFCFPPTLKKLLISLISEGNSDSLLQALPRSITHLEIPAWSKSFQMPPWPPGLTRLATSLDPEYLESMLTQLPTTILQLDLLGLPLTNRAQFDLLPSSLIYIRQDAPNPTDAMHFQDLQKKGLVWIVNGDKIVKRFNTFKVDLDDAIDAAWASSCKE